MGINLSVKLKLKLSFSDLKYMSKWYLDMLVDPKIFKSFEIHWNIVVGYYLWWASKQKGIISWSLFLHGILDRHRKIRKARKKIFNWHRFHMWYGKLERKFQMDRGAFRTQSKIYLLRKYFQTYFKKIFNEKASSQMFEWVLNTPLNHFQMLVKILQNVSFNSATYSVEKVIIGDWLSEKKFYIIMREKLAKYSNKKLLTLSEST